MPSAFEHLIDPQMVAHEGLGELSEALKEKPMLRRAVLLRTATNLRQQLQVLPYEASTAEPVTIEAQDALVLLDLLLRRLG